MKKKALSILLALMLTLTACGSANSSAVDMGAAEPAQETERVTPAGTAGGFSDVPADADYAQAVVWCQANGILRGVGGGRFGPEGSLTRAMLATALYRAEKEPTVSGAPDFMDTQAGAWYSNAVAWADSRGLMQGYGNGLFGPNDPVSVGQLEVILRRYTGGSPEWTGNPSKARAATRAQVATALYNTLKDGSGALVKETGNILVAYFSATGTTKAAAEKVRAVTGGDLFEIVPAEPYTAADLNYNTDCRANQEQNDDSARPAIAEAREVEDMAGYDVVFLGYPIWWGIPPKIMRTFVERCDFGGKTVVPFCTSGGSGFSDEGLRELAPDARWLSGRRLAAGTSQDAVAEWIDTLELPKQQEPMERQITLSFNGHTFAATLEDNSSAKAFAELLRSRDGSMTIPMDEYGGWEKVGSLGQALPSSDTRTTTAAGDLVLYQSNSIVLFYGSNSWSYTRLGRIDAPSGLRDALGGGDVDITFQLADSKEEAGLFDPATGQAHSQQRP